MYDLQDPLVTVLCPPSLISWRANGPTLPISDVYYEKPITPSGDDGRRRRLAPGGPFIGENPGKYSLRLIKLSDYVCKLI